LLETAKVALKGRSKKFQYLLSDMSLQIMEIDGDEFAESDYGLLVDNSEGLQKLNNQLDTLAQAAMQNQLADFSTIMKMYTSVSLAEKQRILEKNEKDMQQRMQQSHQAEIQLKQEEIEREIAFKQQELQSKETMNQRDNEVKLLIAQMQHVNGVEDGIDVSEYSQKDKEELREKIRQFDEKIKLEKEKLSFEKEKSSKELSIKEKVANRPATTSTSKK